ncbi:hypothetical protein T484DRAFT_1802898 [Baffinella frigidus]|nr:hypothetical protein T484DRAFT_1802898 [Cryptophyta sp. CCMP2293]
MPAKKASKGVAKKATGEKKPLVGFFLFSKHHREEVKKNLPAGSAVTEVAKALGVMWKKLPEAKQTAWKAGTVPK